MGWLSAFFAANQSTINALYAQAFFVLGLAVALQWRRESRLELARSVPLLAAFGLAKALFVWGDHVIPHQATLLSASDLALLRLAQHLIFLGAVASLLHFGIRLNWDVPWLMRLPWLMAALGAILLLSLPSFGVDSATTRLWLEQLARPLFIFPGAMLAAWGLRRTAQEIEAMGLSRHVVDWLRVGGFSFGAYALLGGLMIPLTVEQTVLTRFTLWGIPLPTARLIAIGVLAWAMIQALTIFRLELQRAMQDLARLRALASDRERIGRELHDGTIQAIYAAGLMLDNARALMRDDPDSADGLFREGMALLNRTIADIRRYIFALSAEEGQLSEALGQLIREMGSPTAPAIEYRISGTIPRLPTELRDHLTQMARELISNAIRHADADAIIVSLEGEPSTLLLTISDDGCGVPSGEPHREGGHGIPNLLARAAELGARLTFTQPSEGGTCVEIALPVKQPPPVEARVSSLPSA